MVSDIEVGVTDACTLQQHSPKSFIINQWLNIDFQLRQSWNLAALTQDVNSFLHRDNMVEVNRQIKFQYEMSRRRNGISIQMDRQKLDN